MSLARATLLFSRAADRTAQDGRPIAVRGFSGVQGASAPCRTQTVFGLHKCALRLPLRAKIRFAHCLRQRKTKRSLSPLHKETRYPLCSATRLMLATLRDAAPEAAVAKKIDDRIEALEERLKQLKARQARIEARRRSLESRRSRREDTRRKILVGAIVLAKVDQGTIDESVLRGWLKGGLTRADDKALFGL